MNNIINNGVNMAGVQQVNDHADARRVDKKALTKDDFIKIFLAQMKMQNPLKPYDSSAMLQQMSQLTALSASEELQKTIDNLNSNMGKSQLMNASQLIGKHVQVPSQVGQLLVNDGLHGSVILPAPVSEVEITIKNAKGELVQTIHKGSSGSGVVDFDWDGKDLSGNNAQPDYYQISATANIDGNKMAVLTAANFKVQSVALDPRNAAMILNLDGRGGTDMGEIIKII